MGMASGNRLDGYGDGGGAEWVRASGDRPEGYGSADGPYGMCALMWDPRIETPVMVRDRMR
jgi:hypothetical protein